MRTADYQRIEAEIACADSPVGIDAKKTHVMILSKLESIERRLGAIEAGCAGVGSGLPARAERAINAGVAGATDTFDDTVARLAERGVDVDARIRAGVGLIERLTDPGVAEALARIVGRLESLEPITEMASHAPDALAAITDTLDEEFARLRERGIDADAALRNGIAAVLYLGQRISASELEALGSLLHSDVLHPSAVDVVGRLGCALVAAAEAPEGSIGPIGAISKLGDKDARRSTAFLLEFSRRFGAALHGRAQNSTTPPNGGAAHV